MYVITRGRSTTWLWPERTGRRHTSTIVRSPLSSCSSAATGRTTDSPGCTSAPARRKKREWMRPPCARMHTHAHIKLYSLTVQMVMFTFRLAVWMVEIYNGLDPPIGSQNYKTAHIKLSCHMSVSMHPKVEKFVVTWLYILIELDELWVYIHWCICDIKYPE